MGNLLEAFIGALENHQYIIESALRLHNFIADYREEIKGNSAVEEMFYDNLSELDEACEIFMMDHPFEPIGVYGGDEYTGRKGRPSDVEVGLRDNGKHMRDMICNELHRKGMTRRRVQNMRRDRLNRVTDN